MPDPARPANITLDAGRFLVSCWLLDLLACAALLQPLLMQNGQCVSAGDVGSVFVNGKGGHMVLAFMAANSCCGPCLVQHASKTPSMLLLCARGACVCVV